ncbi:hypothetical protein V8C42DRAFT_73250 [Trichoderma barbatum]
MNTARACTMSSQMGGSSSQAKTTRFSANAKTHGYWQLRKTTVMRPSHTVYGFFWRPTSRQESGKDVKLVEFLDEEHALSHPESAKRWLEEEEKWWRKALL